MNRNTYEVKDIFISWNNKDRELKNKLVKLLEDNNFSVWESDSDCVGSISEIYLKQIEKCSIFIVLITENSINSNWVLKEVEVALENKDPNLIIPIVISKDIVDANNYGVFNGRSMFKDTSIIWGYNEEEIIKKLEFIYSVYR